MLVKKDYQWERLENHDDEAWVKRVGSYQALVIHRVLPPYWEFRGQQEFFKYEIMYNGQMIKEDDALISVEQAKHLCDLFLNDKVLDQRFLRW